LKPNPYERPEAEELYEQLSQSYWVATFHYYY